MTIPQAYGAFKPQKWMVRAGVNPARLSALQPQKRSRFNTARAVAAGGKMAVGKSAARHFL